MTANSAVSWIEYVASLAALYVCPTAIAVVRHARNIKRVLILNSIPIAWPAKPGLISLRLAWRPDSITGIAISP